MQRVAGTEVSHFIWHFLISIDLFFILLLIHAICASQNCFLYSIWLGISSFFWEQFWRSSFSERRFNSLSFHILCSTFCQIDSPKNNAGLRWMAVASLTISHEGESLLFFICFVLVVFYKIVTGGIFCLFLFLSYYKAMLFLYLSKWRKNMWSRA